jgi:hypothetical protein
MEENVRAFLDIIVHECSWGDLACCRNLSEAGYMLAELGDWVRWFHWTGCQTQ